MSKITPKSIGRADYLKPTRHTCKSPFQSFSTFFQKDRSGTSIGTSRATVCLRSLRNPLSESRALILAVPHLLATRFFKVFQLFLDIQKATMISSRRKVALKQWVTRRQGFVERGQEISKIVFGKALPGRYSQVFPLAGGLPELFQLISSWAL